MVLPLMLFWSMAQKIISNESVRDQYAKAARMRVLESFGMKRMVKELEENYKLLVAGC